MQMLASDLHPRKTVVPEGNHHAANSAVTDEQVRAAANDGERKLQLAAQLQQ